MRIGAILALLLLSGCTSTTALLESVPDAIGAQASAAVFGGEVSYLHDPEGLVTEEINKTGRRVYSDAQLGTRDTISNAIMRLFNGHK